MLRAAYKLEVKSDEFNVLRPTFDLFGRCATQNFDFRFQPSWFFAPMEENNRGNDLL
jgi:hypothetical protein